MNETTSTGFVIWLTGLPSSGKTSLAYSLQKQLSRRHMQSLILDSDALRAILTPNPTYTPDERDWFYGVITAFAAFLAQNGINVLIAATANRRRYRDQARQQIARFAEVYVKCAIDICEKRDAKGIYAKARAGQATSVPGFGADYEPPLAPETAVDTSELFPPAAAQYIIAQLQAQGVIGQEQYESANGR